MVIHEHCMLRSVCLCRVQLMLLSYLSAAERAVSWSRCPAELQPGSWAGCRCCWPSAGGSAGGQMEHRHNVTNGFIWGCQNLDFLDLLSRNNLRTFELALRPSVAAPCCRGDAEPDLCWWGDRPGSLSSLERNTWARKSMKRIRMR